MSVYSVHSLLGSTSFGEDLNIRESVVIALHSTHLETREHESAIDRIGAFAHGSKLGRLLWRWKYDLEDWRGNAVLDELLIKARKRLAIGKHGPDHPRLILACKQALIEWYFEKCRICRGAAELVLADKRVTCWACQGSSVHRWSRRERARNIGAENFELWEKRLGELHVIIGAADGGTAAEARYHLKEGTNP